MSVASAPSLPPLNLDLTLGALLIGTYISTALFGLTTLQTFNYFNNYSNDRPFIKIFVTAIWILELIHTIFATRTYYIMSVTNFGSFDDFIVLPFVLKFSIVWSNSVSCSVQAFFANRIRIMSGRWELAVICWILSALRYSTSLVAAVEEVKIPEQTQVNSQWKWIIVFVLVVGAVNDVLIAGGLTFFLGKNKSGIPSTDRIVNRLIKFTIQSGLLTSALATAMVISYLVAPDNFVWLAIFVCMAKTYSNTLLATLNARKSIRSGFSRDGGLVFKTSTSSTGCNSSSRPSLPNISGMFQSKKQPQTIAIEMSNVTMTKSDGDSTKDVLKSNANYIDCGDAEHLSGRPYSA